MRPLRILLLHASSEENQTLSYQTSWPQQFLQHPKFECTLLNTQDRRITMRALSLLRVWQARFDAIVLLHSVFSNACTLTDHLFDKICASPLPKIYFIGNEYKLMPEKMDFCKALQITLLISQCNLPKILSLYKNHLHCQVASLPNTGLNTKLFAPTIPFEKRPIDLGYRSYQSPWYLGHNERESIAAFFLQSATQLGLKLDISLDPNDRFTESQWAHFLNQSKGQLGTEAGGDYFELTDKTRKSVNEFINQKPNASFDDVFKNNFEQYPNPLPLRIMSGRNIEAAGTKTVQILFEGHYSGYFKPDIHYIPLKKDFSNATEAIAKFKDDDFCHQLTERAHNLVIENFTYDKLIDRFYKILAPLL